MKRIIMLGIVWVTLLVSLGGCFWGYEDRDRGDRGGGYDRGEGHDHDRGEGHDKGGGHDERR